MFRLTLTAFAVLCFVELDAHGWIAWASERQRRAQATERWEERGNKKARVASPAKMAVKEKKPTPKIHTSTLPLPLSLPKHYNHKTAFEILILGS
tara:strand:- start:1304 stop:1588 length:285 start_codon:yes stop_codon:yes gene_type:complete